MVAQRVVDVLEIVEVDDHQRQLVVLPFAQAQGLAELRLEGQPVGQVGQRVVIGQVGQAVGSFGVGIRLGEIGDVVVDLAVGAADGGNLQPAREGRAVLALVVNFALPEIPGLQGFPDGEMSLRRGFSRGEDVRVLAENLVQAVAAQPAERTVGGNDAVLRVGDQNGFDFVRRHAPARQRKLLAAGDRDGWGVPGSVIHAFGWVTWVWIRR
jgi:hypothetical protein